MQEGQKLEDSHFPVWIRQWIPRYDRIRYKAQATKEKMDKLDFIKIKNFCASKDTIKRVKGLPWWRSG